MRKWLKYFRYYYGITRKSNKNRNCDIFMMITSHKPISALVVVCEFILTCCACYHNVNGKVFVCFSVDLSVSCGICSAPISPVIRHASRQNKRRRLGLSVGLLVWASSHYPGPEVYTYYFHHKWHEHLIARCIYKKFRLGVCHIKRDDLDQRM